MERNFLEIKQWLSDYKRYTDKIIQANLSAVSRICYPAMKYYNKLPDVVPTNYEINFHNLMSDEHKLFLSRYHVEIGNVQIIYDYGDYDVDRWNFKITANKYEKGYEPFVDQLIRIEIAKDDKIISMKPVIYSHIRRRYIDQISFSFDQILLMSMVLMYENELANAVVNILRDAINAKLNAIYQLLGELKSKIEAFDLTMLEI